MSKDKIDAIVLKDFNDKYTGVRRKEGKKIKGMDLKRFKTLSALKYVKADETCKEEPVDDIISD